MNLYIVLTVTVHMFFYYLSLRASETTLWRILIVGSVIYICQYFLPYCHYLLSVFSSLTSLPQNSLRTSNIIHLCALSGVSCGTPAVVAGGYRNTANTIHYPNSVTYRCHTGYTKTSGDLIRNCQTNRAFSGTLPVCTSKTLNIWITNVLTIQNIILKKEKV